MSNISNFPTPKQRRGIEPEVYQSPPRLASVSTLSTQKMVIPPRTGLAPAEALEASLDDYRSTMLELAHRRKAFDLQMHLEENTARLKLEALAYKALVTGVPESDIYALGEDMAGALESAMETVAGA